ncbi:MAG: hypothetical protein IKX23_06840 [Treponema sp.]|nr:hypothetical protein [Treponema sp.]
MNYYIRFLFCTIIFSMTGLVYAQDGTRGTDLVVQADYNEVFELAEALDKSGSDKEAVLEYKRYLFLQESGTGGTDLVVQNPLISQSYKALSEIYERNDNLDLSLNYARLYKNCTNSEESMKREIFLIAERSRQHNLHLTGDYRIFSYIELDGYPENVREYAMLTLMYDCLLANDYDTFIKKYEQSQVLFKNLFTDEEKLEIQKSLDEYNKFKPKKPVFACILSIIPGLGQLYAQDYADAANAFLLNGTLITASVFTLIGGQPFVFALFEFDLVYRFYRGNLYYAQKDTHDWNNKKLLEISEPVRKIIKNNIGQNQ